MKFYPYEKRGGGSFSHHEGLGAKDFHSLNGRVDKF